ncbi:MAG: T9SS type A sorting domain-containing protein [Flavobacteriales bacterium]|nr:T9SS type A sorting domain-containing protein [Flavobacteriales bacterium]
MQRSLHVKAILFSATLLIVPGLRAQEVTIEWSPVLDVNEPGQGGLRPRIALNGEGRPVILWGASGPNRNFVSVLEGSGASTPVLLNLDGLVPAVSDWMGSSIAADDQTVWVVIKATPEEEKGIYARRSLDGGYTWGDTVRVDPRDGLISRFPTVALTGDGDPVVGYMRFTSGWLGAHQVVGAWDTNSFQAPVDVSTPFSDGEVCDCCTGQVMAQGSTVVALFRNAESNQRVIWAASSTDGGATFPSGGIIDDTNWSVSSCPSSGPDGFITGDSLSAVWMSGAGNAGVKTYGTKVRVSDLSAEPRTGVHPGQPQNHQQNFPRLAGAGDTLGVVWENYGAGQRDILFSWSVSGLNGLRTPDTVNVELTGSQRTPDIAFADGAFHIIWDESASGQVRYRRAVISAANGLDERNGTRETLWPNPANAVLNWSANAWQVAEVYDALGRELLKGDARRGNLDIISLSPGRYALRLSTGRGDRSMVLQWVKE